MKQNSWLTILSGDGNPLETYNIPEGNSFFKDNFPLLLSKSENQHTNILCGQSNKILPPP